MIVRPMASGIPSRGAIPALAALAILLLSLGGCGYTTRSIYPTSIQTVAVPVFKNLSFRRNLEFKLTEAIDKNIEARTPYRIGTQAHADSILTGTIVSVQENVLTNRFANNLPQETQVTIVVNFTWKDLRSGKILVNRANFSRSSTVVPQIGQRLVDAEQAAIEKLARSIVDEMQSDW